MFLRFDVWTPDIIPHFWVLWVGRRDPSLVSSRSDIVTVAVADAPKYTLANLSDCYVGCPGHECFRVMWTHFKRTSPEVEDPLRLPHPCCTPQSLSEANVNIVSTLWEEYALTPGGNIGEI